MDWLNRLKQITETTPGKFLNTKKREPSAFYGDSEIVTPEDEKELSKPSNIPLGTLDTDPQTAKEIKRGLFEKAVAEVGACYLPGTLEMIRADFPDLAGEIEQAEDRINELWLKAGKEPVDVGAFREAVDRWKTLHLRAIRFFSLTERPE